jgi:hypothetical protein
VAGGQGASSKCCTKRLILITNMSDRWYDEQSSLVREAYVSMISKSSFDMLPEAMVHSLFPLPFLSVHPSATFWKHHHALLHCWKTFTWRNK